MAIKAPISIEKLLQWAYCDELPKRELGGLTGYERSIFLLGTRIDQDYGEPGFPLTLGPPHHDALLIDHAVRSLSEIVVCWEQVAEEVMGGYLPYAPSDDPILHRTEINVPALVIQYARLRDRPRWQVEVELKRVVGANGKPVVHGITPGGRYGEGSCCPLRLEPPGRVLAQARLEYRCWWEALMALAREVWILECFKPLPPTAAPAPWIEDTEIKPRIWHTTRAVWPRSGRN